MGKTIKLFGFACTQSPEAVKEFLEARTGKGTVSHVEVGQHESSRAHALVEFTTMEAGELIKSLAAERGLWHDNSYLKAWDAEPKKKIIHHRLDGVVLNIGCQISEEKFSVLWSQENVSVKFGNDLRKFNFFLSYNSVDYKLEVPYESISQIELHRPRDQPVKYLVFQLLGAPLIYEKDVHWVREVDFTPCSCIGQSSAICLELPQRGHISKFLKEFYYYKESQGKFFTLEKGSTFSSNYDLVPIITPPKGIDLPFKILFKINSLVQHGCIPGPALNAGFFRLVDPTKISIALIEHALEKLFHLKKCCFEPVSWLKEQYMKYFLSERLPTPPSVALDDGLVYVRKVLVTPSKIYFCGPEVSLSNRVLRSYPDEIDNFLRVSFVDEDLDRLYSTVLSPRNEEKHTRIYQRILTVLREGIVIGDKKFETLASSNSQIKENSLWMFASTPELTAADIRESMGDFCEIKNVAKYAARLGQSFGSSREALHVDSSEVEPILDIEVMRDGVKYVFSDGIGKISAALAETVARKCGLTSYTPSAFQIRYRGYKGVVAVDPTSSAKMSLRESMWKYDSESTSLDVLGWSRYQPCFLNRQLITLLSSLGIKDCVFQRKQKEGIAQLDAILTDPIRAYKALQLMSSGENTNVLKDMLICGYKPDAEPFLSMMLQTFRASNLLDLRTRTRIFIPDGQAMMGCLDETGTLEYGQVFVQYSGSSRFGGSSDEYNIVEGRVVVAKNPCLHPGDMRKLRAVNVPALHHMVDCIVFPAKGYRPHTNECSGSDLDGDVYFVCWDGDLIPPRQFTPMDYTPPPPKVLDRDVTIEDVEKYYVDYIVNDSLGIICNAHVVFADKEAEKAMSKPCIELAKLSSIAVDFSKTGVPAEIPPSLRVKKYPDFMEKPVSDTYESKRVIGKLFREVKDIAPPEAAIKSFTKEVAMQSYDRDMEVNGFEEYIDDAFFYKREYDDKLGKLMAYYGIKTEAEILSGSIMKMAKSFSKKNDLDAIILAARSLKKEARSWFNNDNKKGLSDEKPNYYAKASAWYYVTYHPSFWGQYDEGMNGQHFLSFPWCIHDKLIDIKMGNIKEVLST